jgi:hypothetical protein
MRSAETTKCLYSYAYTELGSLYDHLHSQVEHNFKSDLQVPTCGVCNFRTHYVLVVSFSSKVQCYFRFLLPSYSFSSFKYLILTYLNVSMWFHSVCALPRFPQ